LRILIVSNLYPPIVFGGYEILCSQVTDLLRQQGHQAMVLTSDFRADECGDESTVLRQLKLTTNFPLPGQNVTWVDFTLPTLQKVGRHNAARCQDAIQAFKPDIVFCWCLSRLSLAPVRAAQKLGVPVAYTINDEHPQQFMPAKLEFLPGQGSLVERLKRTFKSAVKTVAERWLWPLTTLRQPAFPITIISHATRDRLIDMGLPIAHSRVIHQGIPLERFDYRELEAVDKPKILFVGQVSRTKGVHTLIQSLAKLGTNNWTLTIVGDGVPEYTQELHQLADLLGLKAQIDFAGRRPHQELPSIYRQHDIFVFPSEWEEPFGLTHLEAMASGCAVVSTTTGGSKELIRDGVNALAFQAGNSEQLAEKLRALITDLDLRQRLGRDARRYVEEHHSLQRYTARLEEFLVFARKASHVV
jgi:glycogen(starch) synthase